MYCDHCGNKLRDGAKFCNKCGATVTPIDDSKNDATVNIGQVPVQKGKKPLNIAEPVKLQKPRRSQKPLVIALSIFAVVAVAAVVLIVVLTGQKQVKKPSYVFREILTDSRDGIRDFEAESNRDGVAMFHYKDKDSIEMFYVQKLKDSNSLNYVSNDQSGIENHQIDDLNDFIVFSDSANETVYGYDTDGADTYLYSFDDAGNKKEVSRYGKDDTDQKEAFDKKLSDICQDDIVVVLTNLDDDQLTDITGDKVADIISVGYDDAVDYLENNDLDQTDDHSAEPATEPRVIRDVESSELPDSLMSFIYAFQFGYRAEGQEYDCENLDNVYTTLAANIAGHPTCVDLSLYPGEDEEESWDLKSDPLGKFDQSGTLSVDEDKVLWIMQNIFNIPEETAQDMLKKTLEKDDHLYEYEKNGKKRLYNMMQGIGDIGSLITYDTVRFDGEKYYIIYHCTMTNLSYGKDVEPRTYYIEVSEKEIDGKKYWSIYRHTKDIPEMEKPTTDALTDEEIFSKFEGGYAFTSGAGFWSSHIDLKSDGTFSGDYHDSNMGESGAGYDATEYQSKFTGRFVNPKKINNYTYSFELESINYENEPGTEEIQARGSAKLLVKYSEAYGLSGGTKTVYAYTPDAPALMLPNELMTWVGHLRGDDRDNAKLMHNCLYAVEPQYGWIGGKQEP